MGLRPHTQHVFTAGQVLLSILQGKYFQQVSTAVAAGGQCVEVLSLAGGTWAAWGSGSILREVVTVSSSGGKHELAGGRNRDERVYPFTKDKERT